MNPQQSPLSSFCTRSKVGSTLSCMPASGRGGENHFGGSNSQFTHFPSFGKSPTSGSFGTRSFSTIQAEWRQLFPRYPAEADSTEGYLRCFEVSDGAGIRGALETYGLCVVQARLGGFGGSSDFSSRVVNITFWADGFLSVARYSPCSCQAWFWPKGKVS